MNRDAWNFGHLGTLPGGAPPIPRPSGRHPFTFAEWVALVVIAASVGFLAGVGLALVLG